MIRILLFSLAFCQAILAQDFGDTDPENPSIRVRITKKGFDYANQLAGKLLQLSIVNHDISTHHTDMGTNGVANLTLSNIVVSRFHTPELKYELSPPHDFRWYCEGGYAVVSADFRLVTTQFVRLDGSGSLRANASGLRFSSDISLAMDDAGKPQIHLDNVITSINNLDIDFSGGMMAWLLAKFRNSIEGQVSTVLARTIAAQVKQVGEQIANAKLKEMPMMVPIGRGMFLDYHMVRNMTVTSDYVDFNHRGQVANMNTVSEIPFGAPGLPEDERSHKMIMVWVSQYLVNSGLYHGHTVGLFNLLINPEMVPQMAEQLRTTCSYGKCIGSAIDGLRKHAPNTTVEIQLTSAQQPECTIIRGMEGPKIVGNWTGVVSGIANGTNVDFFTFNLIYKAYLHVSVEQARLHGEVKPLILLIDIVETNIGRINPLDLMFLESAISRQITKVSNKMIEDGLEIPALKMMRYEYMGVEMRREAVLLYSDLYYRPI